MTRYASMADRLIANSVLSPDHAYDGTPCWEWMRRLNNQGYPTLTRRLKRGPRKGQVVTVFAHRESIVVFTGRRMTPRMVALHLCNNRRCINPEHLKGGTQKQNVRQCVREGRHRTPFRTDDF